MKLTSLLALSMLSTASLFAVTEASAPTGTGYIAEIKTKIADVNDFIKLKDNYTPPNGFKVIWAAGDEIKSEYKKAGYPELALISYYSDKGEKVTLVVINAKGDIDWKETNEFYKSLKK